MGFTDEELKRENKQLTNLDCVFCERQKEQIQKERDALLKLSITMINENLKLGEEVKQLKEENRQFKLSKNCLCDANKRLDEANGFLRRDIIELQNQCCKWNKDYEALTKETAFFEEEIKRLKEENKRLKERSLIDRYNQVTAKNRELKNQELKFEEEIKKLKEENKKLYLIQEKLERDNQETYDDYCEAKGENDELKEQVKCLAECCNKLNDDYCKLKEAKEVKVYKEFDVEEFFKKFGANMEISLSPYTEPSITAYATDLNGVDLLRYSAEYTGRKFDDLFAPLYKYLASSPIERVVIAKELDKIRAAYNNLEAKHNADSEQISKYDEDLRDWKKQAILNAGNYIKAKNTITTLNIQIEKLKGGFKEKDKCIERLRSELQKYKKSKPKQSEADARWEQMWDDYIK